ncbi:MAG: nitrilase-related carbon-nitrogen hydrolase, partial [Alphaproteobacteria bacterium]|nr:nitrilase-related carbon-nitrogen hydrolase [Alphaproteobacteria bacterium]
MTDRLRIALAQMNPTVGNLVGNFEKILDAYGHALEQKADLLVTPELITCGYPPEDLVLKPVFIDRIEQRMQNLLAATKGQTTG